MREIIYRGKRKDNGKWVIGKGIDTNFREAYILYGWKDTSVGLFNVDDIEVIPETIGQYTGLTDKNGVKIFEGDIVQIVNTGDEICLIEWDDDDAAFEVANNDVTQSFLVNLWGRDVEVIGNIHDNPELAEGLL